MSTSNPAERSLSVRRTINERRRFSAPPGYWTQPQRMDVASRDDSGRNSRNLQASFFSTVCAAVKDILEQTLLLVLLVMRLYTILPFFLLRFLGGSQSPAFTEISGLWNLFSSAQRQESGTVAPRESTAVNVVDNIYDRTANLIQTMRTLYVLGQILQTDVDHTIRGTGRTNPARPFGRSMKRISFLLPAEESIVGEEPTATQVYHAAVGSSEELDKILAAFEEDYVSSDDSRIDIRTPGKHAMRKKAARYPEEDNSIQTTPDRFRSPLQRSEIVLNTFERTELQIPQPEKEHAVVKSSGAPTEVPMPDSATHRMEDQRAEPPDKVAQQEPEHPATWTKIFDPCRHGSSSGSMQRCPTCAQRQAKARSRLPKRSFVMEKVWRSPSVESQLSLQSSSPASPKKLQRKANKH